MKALASLAADARQSPLLDTAKEALSARGYRYSDLNERGASFIVRTDHASYRVTLKADEERQHLYVSCRYDWVVDAERRPAVAEVLCRLNERFSLGNFDLTFATGEVGFRRGVDVSGGTLTGRMADHMVSGASYAMELCELAILEVARGESDPATAVQPLFEGSNESRAHLTISLAERAPE